MRRKPQSKVLESAALRRANSDAWQGVVRRSAPLGAAYCRNLLTQDNQRAWSACRMVVMACGLVFSLVASGWGQALPATGTPEISTYADVVQRDRELQRLLTKISTLLKANQINEALDGLQRCFSYPDDAFVLSHEWSPPALRGIATKLLHDAGETAWKNYEAKFGAEARRALDRVEQNGPPGSYQGVIRRYEHTVAGAMALDRLASWHLGRAEYDLAANCWERLLSNPVHAADVTVVQRMKLFFAASRNGDAAIAQREAVHLTKTRVVLGGRALTASEWRTKLEQLPEEASRSALDWRLLGGAPERMHVRRGSAPFLMRPSATFSMFDPGERAISSPEDHSVLREGRVQQERDFENAIGSDSAVGFAGTPIVMGNLIVWRDSFGLRAIDQRTGRSAWTFATSTRLHPLMVFNVDSELQARAGQSTYRQNSVLEQLTSDGRQVYFVDRNTLSDRTSGPFAFDQGELTPRNEGKLPTGPWNCLVALKVSANGAPPSVAWQIGGHPIDEPSVSLAGHFFLGPPLSLGELLYCVAEFQKQICLIAVHAETGHIEWRQTLSLAPISSRESTVPPEKVRLSSASLIGSSHGILVCPLSSGILVGINQITGEIVWAYDYRVRRKGAGFQYSQFLPYLSEQFADGDFPSPPLIRADHVFFLAPGPNTTSDQIVCLDLQTGRKSWHADTTSDLKYLAYADQDSVIGVGGSDVIALSAKTGASLWKKRVPRISGIGAALPGGYLLPIADGRVLCLDLRDGSEIGFAMRTEGVRPGNLVISGRDVISLNGLDLQVFPQSAELLASLELKPQNQQHSYQFWYEMGELQFQLGQLNAAKTSLNKALTLAEPSTQSMVRDLMRELAWSELQQQPDQRGRILAEYAELCELPEQRAQYLLLKSEEEFRRGNLALARRTSLALSQLNVTQPLRILADPDRNLTAAVWGSELAKRGLGELQDLSGESLSGAIDALLRQNDRQALQLFLDQNPEVSRIAEVRLALAKLLVQAGETQAAELLVWDDHQGSTAAALGASRFLLELWDAVGLYEEAGLLLNEMRTRLKSVTGNDGVSGGDIYAGYRRDSLVWAAAQRFQPPDWQIDTVRIREEHDVDLRLRNTFNTAPRYLHFPHSTQQLLIRGQQQANLLQQIDGETGSIVADIRLPSDGMPTFFPYFDARNRVGHFLPLGGNAHCYGISLLERSLAWHRGSTTQLRLANLIRVGPTTPQTAVFRTRDRLLGLHPATGEIRWERSELAEGGGPMPSGLTTLPGDAEAVLLLESDSKNYRLFKTSDGSFIRQGTLENCVYVYQQFGRNLLYSTDIKMRNIQLWDPLKDKVLFEASGMATTVGMSDRDLEFTVADTLGKVSVIDGLTGQVKIQIQLNPLDFQFPQQPPMLKSFTDGSRYYVNVHRQLQMLPNMTIPSDAMFPTQQISGDLHAVDPATSKVLWTRTKVSPQSVVLLSDYRLPFLVTLSRSRGLGRVNAQTSTRIDVIDGAKGTTLVSKNNAYNDRLFLLDYNRTAGKLRFRGAVTQIHMDFGRDVNPQESSGDEYVGHQQPALLMSD